MLPVNSLPLNYLDGKKRVISLSFKSPVTFISDNRRKKLTQKQNFSLEALFYCLSITTMFLSSTRLDLIIFLLRSYIASCRAILSRLGRIVYFNMSFALNKNSPEV